MADTAPRQTNEKFSSLSATLTQWHYIIPPVFLSVVTWLFYSASLRYNFQFDDVANISKFFGIRHNTFWDLFGNHPRWISYWLNSVNYAMDKFNPYYYRVFNVTIHTVTGVLVYFLVLNLLKNLKKDSFFTRNGFAIACTTAALFLLHPVQSQTVSYVIQGRLEGTAGLFVVAMALCFFFIAKAQNNTVKYGLTALLLLLSYLSTGTKEIAIVSPALLLLVDWFFIAQGNLASMKERMYVHLAVFGVVFGMYVYFLKPQFFINMFGLQMQARNNIGNILTDNFHDKINPMHYFISQFKVILHYITMFIWPFNICVEYDWKLVKSFFSPDCIFPLMVLMGLAYGVWYRLQKNSIDLVAFGALWFFVGVIPRSSIVPSSELLTDYKTYLASVGLLLVFAAGLVWLFNFVKERYMVAVPFFAHAQAQYALACVLVLPVGLATYQRNKVWRSGEEFWRNVIANAPEKARAYNNLGVALSEKGQLKESIPLYKKAIAMDRNYPDPCNNLAVAYSMTGKVDLAIKTLQDAIKMHPYYPEAYNNLASFFINKKEYDKAEKVLNIAIKIRPHYGKAYFNLGKLNMEKGNSEKALSYFRTACTKADLDTQAGYGIYASMAVNLRKFDDAIFAYTKLLEFTPGSVDLLTKLAHVYLLNKNFEEGKQLYLRIVKVQPQNARAWYNLGECYLQQNNPVKAFENFKQAVRLNIDLPQVELRIVTCLEQVGRFQEAKQILESYLGKQNVPDQFKTIARASLAQLDTLIANQKPSSKTA